MLVIKSRNLVDEHLTLKQATLYISCRKVIKLIKKVY